MIAWTIAGVLAVAAAIVTVLVKGDSAVKFTTQQESLPKPEISTPLTKREPNAPYDTAWLRVGTRQYQATVSVNGESRGEIHDPRWLPAPAGRITLSIHAPTCRAWDTTLTVAKDARITIGMRMPLCP